jgi:hypothetical protein
MNRKKREERNEGYGSAGYFMIRIAGVKDEVLVCKAMREILIQAREIYSLRSVTLEAYVVLEQACVCLEATFYGHVCKDLLDAYYKLGVVLMGLGYEELGVACQYLHHTFSNRAYSCWPPSMAWYHGRGRELLNLLPIFTGSFPDFESDTVREGGCISS